MAEVIGLIASIISILDGIHEAASFIRKHVHSTKSLREELIPVVGKLTAFKGILQGLYLQYELDESDQGRLHVLVHLSEPLKACSLAIKTIMARLDKIGSKGRTSLTFGKLFDKDTLAALRVLDNAKTVLDLALSADQMTLLKSIESYTRHVGAELQILSRTTETHFKDLHTLLETQHAVQFDDEKLKKKVDILDWISKLDCSSSLSTTLKYVLPNDHAGEWLFQSENFKRWTDFSGYRVITLAGNCTGKSVLSAKVISKLARESDQTLTDSIVAYHFFDFNDNSTQTVEGMVRNIIRQIVSKVEDIPDAIIRQHKKCSASQGFGGAPDLSEWVKILVEILSTPHSVFIVIDGLDECLEVEQALLTATFQRLLNEQSLNVKWMLTFRPSPLFASILSTEGCDHVTMQPEVIDKDVEPYLRLRLNSEPALVSFSQRSKDLIVEKVSAKSGGMFRWAQCQLDALKEVKDRRLKNVEQILNRMPDDLFKTYRRILGSLGTVNERALAIKVLSFVCHSARPITTIEAAEFAILEDGMNEIQPGDRFESFEDVLLLLGNMVNVDKDRLRLSHKSVHEFLLCIDPDHTTGLSDEEKKFFDPHGGADTHIAKRCLQYLAIKQRPASGLPGKGTAKSPNAAHLKHLTQSYPLLEYAATKWSYHLRQQRGQLELRFEMLDTLAMSAKPNLWKAWIMLQPADIWENQLALSQLLCEAVIRAAHVPDLCLHFWKERQAYRVSSSSNVTGRLSLQLENSEPSKKIGLIEYSKKQEVATRSLATVLHGIQPSRDMLIDYNVDAAPHLHRKDITLVEAPSNDGEGTPAQTELEANPLQIANAQSRLSSTEQISGLPLYNLTICLLEIATQTSIQSTNLGFIDDSCQEAGFQQQMKMFEKSIELCGTAMGDAYVTVVQLCVSNVTYLPEYEVQKLRTQIARGTTGRDLYAYPISAWSVFCNQNELMEKLHTPLLAMFKSGYRASRQSMKSLHLRNLSKEIDKNLSIEPFHLKVASVLNGQPANHEKIQEQAPIDQFDTNKSNHQDPNQYTIGGMADPEVPPALDSEVIERQARLFMLDYDDSRRQDNENKMWMADFCQHLLTDMAGAISDKAFSKALDSRKQWFRKATTSQRTAILYTLSSESTLMQQYFLAQVILQRLENKPLVVMRNTQRAPEPAATVVSKANTKKMITDIKGRGPPVSYFNATTSFTVGNRFSEAIPSSKYSTSQQITDARWSQA